MSSSDTAFKNRIRRMLEEANGRPLSLRAIKAEIYAGRAHPTSAGETIRHAIKRLRNDLVEDGKRVVATDDGYLLVRLTLSPEVTGPASGAVAGWPGPRASSRFYGGSQPRAAR